MGKRITQERKEYLRNYQRNWMRDRRGSYFKDKCCEECGSTEKLELHHIDPSNKFTHKIWSYREDIREKEIAKCSVLCQRCHLKETIVQHSYHSKSRYSKGCRCEICRYAKKLSNDKYKHKLDYNVLDELNKKYPPEVRKVKDTEDLFRKAA